MSYSFSNSVWERRVGGDTMPQRVYVMFLTLWTLGGIMASAWAAHTFLNTVTKLDQSGWVLPLLMVLGVFAISIIGIIIALKSDSPPISLLGYALVAVLMGAISGPFVAMYTSASVVKVLLVTMGMVGVLGFIGIIIPKSLESWGGWLLGGLTILIIGQFMIPMAGAFGAPISGALTIVDWCAVVLFSGYVVFDFNRAMRLPYTLDNSIDCALAIYLDFINLFLHLLRIMGSAKSDD